MSVRVAIANRGEVAMRIIRACQELGYTSVLLHSTPDKSTPAFRAADETRELAGNTPAETYLNINAVVAAAHEMAVDMLHPGFGFLSENARFAQAVLDAGIKFVGPTPEAISLAGNKIKAKELAMRAKVPVVPSYTGDDSDHKKLLSEIKKIGFPLIIKAASGGGGKGMKVVRSDTEFLEMLASAKREAKAAFGSDRVFIEKYLENPRHIEVQILFDTFGEGIHLFERECSIQRRHQKIFEETPSSALTPELRDKITRAALVLAAEAKYVNAGTVEFLVDNKNHFYFMELNTRLQVEHTVTEQVCGIDLVQLQFAITQGAPLPLEQKDIHQRGHALEVRVYAENPEQEFLPSTGKLEELKLPLGPQRRFDFGYEQGDEMTPFYDPMIGKIITWAPTRETNLYRMAATLAETVIFGVHTNIEFLKAVLETKKFKTNNVSTSFLAEEFSGGFKPPPLTPAQQEFAKSAVRGAAREKTAVKGGALAYESPWASLGENGD